MSQGRTLRVRGDMSRSEAGYRMQRALFYASAPDPSDPGPASWTENILSSCHGALLLSLALFLRAHSVKDAA